MSVSNVDPWLLSHLVCPRDHSRVNASGDSLTCERGHRYAIVDDVPVMLVNDAASTLPQVTDAVTPDYRTQTEGPGAHLHLDTLGISEREKRGVLDLVANGSRIDPVVAYLVAATNGLMYRDLVGSLATYPIPDSPLPEGRGLALDVGCSWGRWTIAASRRGYEVAGVDPSIGAVMAARRVAAQLGVCAHFVVGDARYLPFVDGQFDRVVSYSVLQHFSKRDLELALANIGRVLRKGGQSHVQMAARYGVRCLYHQARRGFADGTAFDVRYWSLRQLRDMFERHVGRSTVVVDCYFGIGLQPSDAALMSRFRRSVLAASSVMKAAQRVLPFLIEAADSVYVHSVRAAHA